MTPTEWIVLICWIIVVLLVLERMTQDKNDKIMEFEYPADTEWESVEMGWLPLLELHAALPNDWQVVIKIKRRGDYEDQICTVTVYDEKGDWRLDGYGNNLEDKINSAADRLVR